MGRSDHRKRRGCFVYLGATLLVVGTLVPVTRYSWSTAWGVEWHRGSLYDLSREDRGYHRFDFREFVETSYHAALGCACLPGEGDEFYGLLVLAVVAIGAFHLRRSRLVWVPSAALAIWTVFALWRFIGCMDTVPLPDDTGVFLLVEGPFVSPWGWVAAVTGAIILCLEALIRERRRDKTPEQLRRVFK